MGRPKKHLKTATSQPEHEINQQVLGVVDEAGTAATSGTVPVEKARKLGAFNAEAVSANRRREEVVNRKRSGEANVPWGEANACLLYDDILSVYAASTMSIQVTRLEGQPTSWYVYGYPRNGQELYQAIQKQCHGRSAQCEYLVVFRDANMKSDRGRGRIVMPSTVDEVVQQQPAGASAPPYYAPGQPSYGPMPNQPPAPQMSGPVPYYGGVPGAPPPQPSPPAAPTLGIPDVSALLQQLTAFAAHMQQQQQPPRPAPAAAPPAAAQPAPTGYVPPAGYVLVTTPNGQTVLAPAQGFGLGAPQAAPPTPPAPVLTPAEQFRQSMSLAQTAISTAREMSALVPSVAAAPAAAAPAKEDEAPIRTTQIGEMHVVTNNDGTLRPVETLIANGEKVMGWIEKQQKTWQDHATRVAQMSAPQLPNQQQQNGQTAPAAQGTASQMTTPTIPTG